MKLKTAIAALAVVGAMAAPAAAFVPHGYVKAHGHAKVGMDRTAKHASHSFKLKRTFAWLLKKSNHRYGVVCGYHHGRVTGDPLKRRHNGSWKILVTSGPIQSAYAACKEY
jgi:hypothetical protein